MSAVPHPDSAPAVALVTGATGVVGRNLLAHLATLPHWSAIAVSRRPPEPAPRQRHLAVDLLDPADCAAKLGAFEAATHVFHCAYAERPTATAMIEPNLAMLHNVVRAVEPAAQGLRHVHLTQGTKYYGSHLGPFRTPARESDARPAGPNFYHDLQDWLETRQRGRAWTWSAARPHAVIGFALGNPMNLSTVIAVYATLCKAAGEPFGFPGTPAAFRALYQCTEAGLLARAMTWMATTPACANQAFNITNGDLIRWENLWPQLAAFFDVTPGPVRGIRLATAMAGKGPLWDETVHRHGLLPHRYDEIVSWPYGDAVFSSGWDIVSDTGKARRAGFADCVDTEAMFLDLFASYRARRIIP